MASPWTIIGEAQQKSEKRNITPTVLIGIGGTGKEVLKRVRRFFVQRLGNLDDFPIVSYLLIDTDNNQNLGEQRQEGEWDAEFINFNESERVLCNIEVGSYVQNLPRYMSDLPINDKLKELGDLKTGAGQIRPAARIALYHHYNKIKKAIMRARDNVTMAENVDIMQKKHNINITQGTMQYVVIFSIAGGTGSGMFLDVSFLLKEIGGGESTGFLFLPSVYKDYKEKVLANGYAALKELNYYLNHQFEVQWNENEDRKKIMHPPFDFLYLVDNKNLNGISHRVEHLYELVAENIFLEFGNSDFAEHKRSIRVNNIQFQQQVFAKSDPNINEYLENLGLPKAHTSGFVCRPNAFGLGIIRFPYEKIKRACAYRLALDLIDYWSGSDESEQPKNFDREAKDVFLEPLKIRQEPFEGAGGTLNIREINEALLLFSGTNLRNTSTNEVNNLISQLNGLIESPKNILPFLKRKRKEWEQNLTTGDGEESKMGSWFHVIFINTKRLKAALRDGIINISNNLLDSGKGKKYLENILGALKGIVLNNPHYKPYYSELKLRSQKRRGDGLESINIEIQKTEQTLQSLKGKTLKVSLQDQHFIHFTDRLNEWLKDEIGSILGDFGEDLCYYIASICDDEMKKLQMSGGVFDSIRGRIESRFKEYKKTENTSGTNNPNIISLYEEKDFESIYKSVKPDIKIADKYFWENSKFKNLVDFTGHLKHASLDDLKNFELQLSNNLQKLIKIGEDFPRLLQNITNKSAKISNLYSNAAPMIPKCTQNDISASMNLFDANHNTNIYSCPESLSRSEIEANLRSGTIAGEQLPQHYSSANDYALIFYREISGFPIPYLSQVINELEREYQKVMTLNEIPHTQKEFYKFHEINLETEAFHSRLIEAEQAFHIGVILGIIQPKKDNSPGRKEGFKVREYEFQKTEPIPISLKLGKEDEVSFVLRFFSTVTSTFEEINRKIYKTEILISKNETKLIQYLGMLKYYIKNVFRPTKIKFGEADKDFLPIECEALVRKFYNLKNDYHKYLLNRPDFDNDVRKVNNRMNEIEKKIDWVVSFLEDFVDYYVNNSERNLESRSDDLKDLLEIEDITTIYHGEKIVRLRYKIGAFERPTCPWCKTVINPKLDKCSNPSCNGSLIVQTCFNCKGSIYWSEDSYSCPLCSYLHRPNEWPKIPGDRKICVSKSCRALILKSARICPICGISQVEEEKKCKKCNTTLKKDDIFCPNCGPESKCQSCGSSLALDAKFCSKCGSPISDKTKSIKCNQCGKELLNDMKFCPNCGKQNENS